jgi:transcriptional regulator with XRE-family HTH domain
MELGERIRAAIKASGKTIADVAREMGGMDPSQLRGILHGKDIRASTLRAIGDATGVSLDYLTGRGEQVSTSISEDAQDLLALFRRLESKPGAAEALLTLARVSGNARGRRAVRAFAASLLAEQPGGPSNDPRGGLSRHRKIGRAAGDG